MFICIFHIPIGSLKQFYSNNETMSSVLKFIDYEIDTTKKCMSLSLKNTKVTSCLKLLMFLDHGIRL